MWEAEMMTADPGFSRVYRRLIETYALAPDCMADQLGRIMRRVRTQTASWARDCETESAGKEGKPLQ